MKQERVCFLCGRNGAGDPLDEHHVFNGANRKKSDKLGMTVYLCHERCHIFGKYAVHHNAYVMNELKRYAQREFMMREGVGLVEFRLMFGKSYIGEDEDDIVTLFDLPMDEREAAIESPQSLARQLPLLPQGEPRGTDCHDQCAHWSRNDRCGETVSEADALWESAKREYRIAMEAVRAAIRYDEAVELPY